MKHLEITTLLHPVLKENTDTIMNKALELKQQYGNDTYKGFIKQLCRFTK